MAFFASAIPALFNSPIGKSILDGAWGLLKNNLSKSVDTFKRGTLTDVNDIIQPYVERPKKVKKNSKNKGRQRAYEPPQEWEDDDE